MRRSGIQLPVQKLEWSGRLLVSRSGDWDNLVARCKWPLDALVSAGIAADDSPDHLAPKGWPKQEIAKRGLQGVYLEIFTAEENMQRQERREAW